MSSESQNSKNCIFQFFLKLPLSVKITGWYSIFLLILLLVLSAFILQFTHSWEDTNIRTTLQQRVINTAENPQKFQSFGDGVFTIIYTREGNIQRGTVPDGFPLETALSPYRVTTITAVGTSYYYYDTPIQKSGFDGWVRGIIPVSQMTQRTSNMMLTLFAGGLGFLIIAICSGYFLLKRGLHPLRLITKMADEISQNKDLSQRLPLQLYAHDEITHLTSTFNHMLDNLEKCSQYQKEFNSDISHELRTPIAVIQAESDFGRKYVTDIAEAKEGFEHIFKQTKYMGTIITQLLDLARLENLENLPQTIFSLTNTLTEVADEYRSLCVNSSHEIAVGMLQIPEGPVTFTSDIEDDVSILGSEILLRRAVSNLLDNALKFTKNSIHLTLAVQNNKIVISVKDNGIGINQSEIPKIWNRLYQIEPSRNKETNKGIGLGLYFVESIAKIHNSTISVESEPNNGSIFSIHIPIIRLAKRTK